MKHITATIYGADILLDAPIKSYPLVTDATRQHERLSVRYHNLHIGSFVNAAKRTIERIHADGAEHINALVY